MQNVIKENKQRTDNEFRKMNQEILLMKNDLGGIKDIVDG